MNGPLYIDDYNPFIIRISNWAYFIDVPKFQIDMQVEEPFLYLSWADTQKGTGGPHRMLTINYLDVVDGYAGYLDNPSSATQLKTMIEAMQVSGFAGGGDTLLQFGDIMSHNGTSDEIFPLGTNEYVHVVDTTEPTGHKYVAKSVIVDGGLSVADTDTLDLTKTGASISGRVLLDPYHLASYSSWNPIDGTTAYFNGTAFVTQTNTVGKAIYPTYACTILGVNLNWNCTAVAGSNENVSIYLRVNDTTDYLIATVGNTNAIKVFQNMALSIAMNGTTDFYFMKVVCPTWVVQNPTSVGFQGTVYMKIA